jgi:hypothetical protein
VSRADPFARPLDAALERMRVHSLGYTPHPGDIRRWVGRCPSCREYALVLHEPFVGGSVSVTCGRSCDESRIIAGLAAAPEVLSDHALELAEQGADLARRAIELADRSCR